MKSNKTDLRSKYTQKIVKDTIINILKTKPINKITVSELCKAAEINRGTFYNHFYDVHDVYECIEQDFYNEIVEKLDKIKAYSLNKSFFNEIMLFIYNNIDFVKLILRNTNESTFFNKIINYVQNKFINEWSENYGEIPIDVLQLLFTYMINGGIGIISYWVQNDMKQFHNEIASLIEDLNSFVISHYIKSSKFKTMQ